MRFGIETEGVDFALEKRKQTKADREFISKVIANYKATGEITRVSISKTKQSKSEKELITKP